MVVGEGRESFPMPRHTVVFFRVLFPKWATTNFIRWIITTIGFPTPHSFSSRHRGQTTLSAFSPFHPHSLTLTFPPPPPSPPKKILLRYLLTALVDLLFVFPLICCDPSNSRVFCARALSLGEVFCYMEKHSTIFLWALIFSPK